MGKMNEALQKELDDIEEMKKLVENAEIRARDAQTDKNFKGGSTNDRIFSKALHREADELYQRGDLEGALVLYHRAGSVYPRDGSHNLAARKTEAAISSWNDLSSIGKAESSRPELTALKALNRLKQSPNPSTVSDVLRYFDDHKSYWRTKTSGPPVKARVSRGKRRKVEASLALKKLESSFEAGDMWKVLKSSKDFLSRSTTLLELKFHVKALRLQALAHVALSRHDLAVNSTAKMAFMAKLSKDPALICLSIVTLGKIHVTFGHFHATSIVLNKMAATLSHPLPKAWVLHDIGRCHFEIGNYGKALEMGKQCLEMAEEASSRKWSIYGELLRGQSLIKLNRLGEAVEPLKISAKLALEERDEEKLTYITDLTKDVLDFLKKRTFGEGKSLENLYESGESSITTGRSWKKSRGIFSDDSPLPALISKYKNDFERTCEKMSSFISSKKPPLAMLDYNGSMKYWNDPISNSEDDESGKEESDLGKVKLTGGKSTLVMEDLQFSECTGYLSGVETGRTWTLVKDDKERLSREAQLEQKPSVDSFKSSTTNMTYIISDSNTLKKKFT